MCAEDSAADRLGDLHLKLPAEFFIELVRLLWNRCPNEGGPVAFSGAGKQCKLADHQKIACNVLHGEIHRPILIWKNPQPSDLAGQPNDVFPRIGRFDAEENQQSSLDLTDDLFFTSTEARETRWITARIRRKLAVWKRVTVCSVSYQGRGRELAVFWSTWTHPRPPRALFAPLTTDTEH